MSLKKGTVAISASALGVMLLLLCVGIYFLLFHMHTTAHVVSVSPDGMYKCELIERTNGGQSPAQIVLYRRLSPWTPDWGILDSADVHNDSACRSNYSVDWEYNEKHRSTGVVVFGDFGGAPFEGTVVFERALDPNAKLRGEK
jgi:hypothetical protein